MFNNGYNNYGYGGYSTPYGMPQQPATQQMSFVNGIEGAKGYIVPPGSTMFLMDSDSEQFFIKTADHNGMCNIKVYEFKEKALTPPAAVAPIDTTQFVTREEFAALVESVKTLSAAPVDTPKKTLL